jgi:8-oxo-dGTP pyrophosphatase MutT (NUDIX family)
MTCPPDPDVPATSQLRAAAVCYRHANGDLQFLLVRTKVGRTWTIPKGHVEQGETTRQAALREAREEAGVTGEVEDRPFTRYRYLAASGLGPPAEVCVEAYLLSVDSQSPPGAGERMRTPQWFAPHEAIVKLSQHRDPLWGREHRRLIEAAVSRLRS